jgi:membrane-associated phospholipid phosphatase
MRETLEEFARIFILNFGKSGPLALFIYSVYLLWNKGTLLYYYISGVFLDAILNLVLKGIIKEPRPSEDPKLFNVALKHSIRFKFINGYPYDVFGMPSGHAESVFFSTVFIYLALKDIKITILYLIISLLTMYQRVLFNSHTVLQVLAGSLVGILFAGFIYFMAQQKIIGKLRAKKDDNGPI